MGFGLGRYAGVEPAADAAEEAGTAGVGALSLSVGLRVGPEAGVETPLGFLEVEAELCVVMNMRVILSFTEGVFSRGLLSTPGDGAGEMPLTGLPFGAATRVVALEVIDSCCEEADLTDDGLELVLDEGCDGSFAMVGKMAIEREKRKK